MLNKFLVVMCYVIMGVNMYNCNIFNKNVDLYNLEYRKQHHYFSLLTQVNLYVISVHRYCYISVLISLHKHVFFFNFYLKLFYCTFFYLIDAGQKLILYTIST